MESSNHRGPAVTIEEVPESSWSSTPASRWRLEEDLRIGAAEGGGPDVFGSIRNLIPAEDGGVWVYDWQAVELRRFDGEGRHMLSVGRQGQGPGEFSGNSCAWPGVDDEVWVETETNWHRFSAAGDLLGTFPTPSTMACAVRAWISSREFVTAGGGFDRATRSLTSYFVRHEWQGDSFTPVDTFPGPDVDAPRSVTFVNASGRSRSERALPFIHNPGSRLQHDGTFLVWDGGGDYLIRRVSLRGDTVQEIHRAYVPVPVSAEEHREAMDDFIRVGWEAETDFDRSEVPENHPPFETAVLSEDGSIWVQRIGDEGLPVWDIFSADSEYLGELEIPSPLAGLAIRAIGRDHVWGVLRGDLDIPFVVRARLLKGDS